MVVDSVGAEEVAQNRFQVKKSQSRKIAKDKVQVSWPKIHKNGPILTFCVPKPIYFCMPDHVSEIFTRTQYSLNTNEVNDSSLGCYNT